MTTSTVYLRESATGMMVAGELHDEVSDAHLAMWDATWTPVMKAHCAGQARSRRPEDGHWDWRRKANAWRPLVGYQSFAIVCRGVLEGLMLTSDFKSARLPSQFGKPLVYVEFVATAPWNRSEVQKPPRYTGVGGVFVDTAIQLSLDSGFRGRVGLHSLPQAVGFYRLACGMTALGVDSAHESLMYFEMTAQVAAAFRRKRGAK